MNVDNLMTFLNTETNTVGTVIATALFGSLLTYYLKRRETKDRLTAEYDHEQKKLTRQFIGEYHGRMIRAAVSLNNRMWNLYENHHKNWLKIDGEFGKSDHYYFSSFFHRVMCICSLSRQFESKAIYLDGRFATKNDQAFLNYLDAFHWALTDVALFKGLDYNIDIETDHFFSDKLKLACDNLASDGNFISFGEIQKKIKDDRSFDNLLRYFDGLNKSEARYRWDRLVVLQLLLMSFLNRFGYKKNYSTLYQFFQVAGNINNPQVLSNFTFWFKKLGLVNSYKERALYVLLYLIQLKNRYC